MRSWAREHVLSLARNARSPGRLLRLAVALLGLGAWAWLVTSGVREALHHSRATLSEARRWSGYSPLEARRRTFGATYVDAVEEIRRSVSPDEPYLLVPEGAQPEQGWEFFLRYELAPRLPRLAGSLDGLRSGRPLAKRLPERIHWAVVRQADGTPRLFSISELQRFLDDAP